jgi:protocadherin-16/23
MSPIVIWTLLLLVKHGTCQDQTPTKEFHISEGLQSGAEVGTLGENTDGFFIYTDKNEDIDIEQVFTIGSAGKITTKVVLDREQRSLYTFFAVPLSGSGSTFKVKINVQDINDNSPQFPLTNVNKEITESTPADAKYPLGSATDKDIGINNVQRYEIVQGNIDNVFRLGAKRAINNILFVDLEINGPLDFETVSTYNLLIRAYDGGSPPRSGDMRLNISITDVNDNQPIFNMSRYSGSVDESTVVGTVILMVTATDADSGNNGKVGYYIDRTRSDPNENFNVDAETGAVVLNKKLDFEQQTNYELVIVAQDSGSAKLQTSAVVSIKVVDINDNEPVISIVFLTADKSPRLSENAKPGDFVARISVSDPDVHDSHVNVTLDGGNGHFGLTTQDNVVYLVILNKPLDRELKPSYHLTVRAMDAGTPPKSAVKSFTILVTDTNDNAPQFTQVGTYYADIQEVVPVGSSVIQVSAMDRDDGNNSNVVYLLLSTPTTHSDWFTINNSTGLITTMARVDCKTTSQPRLTVVATDSGVPPKSVTATVVVRIHDVNDNQPVFDLSYYTVSVPEDQSVGSCILKVSATDPDCGLNSPVAYRIGINQGFAHPEQFTIQNTTGDICIVAALDYETKPSYEFPVVARDQDGLDTTAMVKIQLRDINDNRPVFYPAQYDVNLEQNSASGTEIVAVHATDGDSGVFGTLTYRITSGNTQALFAIDASTGVIRLQRSLSASGQTYTLSTSARDGGDLEALSAATVAIRILDPSQKPPAFSQSLYQFTITEGASPRTRIGTVVAANTNTNAGSMSYTILSGDPDNKFLLDSVSGDLLNRVELDHDTVPSMLITIQAQSGTPPVYATAQVNVSITDMNDNSPTFPVSSMEFPVKEDTTVNTVIYAVQALDADSGSNGLVRYRIQDASNAFTTPTIRRDPTPEYSGLRGREAAFVDHYGLRYGPDE